MLLQSLVQDPSERQDLFTAVQSVPVIRAKAEWSIRWIEDSTNNFATRLIAFAAVEGIFFSSSFASIYWFKTRGLMPGTCFSNELISRDEGMHTRFACLLLRHIIARPTESVVHQIVLEAVELEKAFVKGIFFSKHNHILTRSRIQTLCLSLPLE